MRVPHVVVLEIDTYKNEKKIPPSQPYGSLVCSKQKRDFENGRPEQAVPPDGLTRRITRKVSVSSFFLAVFDCLSSFSGHPFLSLFYESEKRIAIPEREQIKKGAIERKT